jgi:hypothetical protein
MNTGAGVLIQGNINMGMRSFHQYGGDFEGNTWNWISATGDFISTGTLGYNNIALMMTGNNTVIRTTPEPMIYGLAIGNHSTVQTDIHVGENFNLMNPTSNLSINSGITVFDIGLIYGGYYTNIGKITGPGTMYISFSWSQSFTPGTILSDLTFASKNPVENVVIKISSNFDCPGYVLIKSTDNTYYFNFDLNGKNMIFGSLNETSIGATKSPKISSSSPGAIITSPTINLGISGSAGILDITNITINTNFIDNTNGTLIHGNGIVNIPASDGKLKLASGQYINNLNFNYSGGVPKWEITAASGPVRWNITNLPIHEYYIIQENGISVGHIYLNSSVLVPMVYSIFGTVTFRLIAAHWVPIFVSTPPLTGNVNTSYNYMIRTNETSYLSAILPSGAVLVGNTIFWYPAHIGVYSFEVMAISANDTNTAYQNWTVVVNPVYVAPPIDYLNIGLVIIFMTLVTIFNFYGHREKMLAIQLIAIVIMLPGVVWAFMIMPGTWEIPLLFIMANLVIFVMDAARGRN